MTHNEEVEKISPKLIHGPNQHIVILQKPIPDAILVDFKERAVTAIELCRTPKSTKDKLEYCENNAYLKRGYSSINIIPAYSFGNQLRTRAQLKVLKFLEQNFLEENVTKDKQLLGKLVWSFYEQTKEIKPTTIREHFLNMATELGYKMDKLKGRYWIWK